MLLAHLLPLLLGCGPDACQDLPETSLRACVGGAAVESGGFPWTGTVTEITTGAFPASCTNNIGIGADQSGTVLVIEDDAGGRTTVGLSVGAGPVAVGDTVSVDMAQSGGGWSASVGHLVLAAEDGTELAVVAQAGTIAEVRAPNGVSLGRGAAVCTESDTCGTWSAFNLLVSADWVSQGVPYGEDAQVGPWRVFHGGAGLGTERLGSTCQDWRVGYAIVGFVREE